MKKTFFIFLSGAAMIIFSVIISSPLISRDMQVFSPVRYNPYILIIDAGHGGEDGGAVSSSGAHESMINLAIAQKLDLIMGFYGAPVIMLRSSDISLHDNHANTIKEKKVSDLHNRVKLINSTENAVLISIHQNSFSDPRYSGSHVFYADTDKSSEFAEQTQTLLRLIDPDNNRVPAKIYDTVFLMNQIDCPAILVECGFLSNPEEAALLQTSDYQTEIAATLAAAYLQFHHSIKG